MTLLKKILLPLACFALLPISAWSATIHVSTGGNNTSGTGSISAPFATIQKAIDTATIYDTILVAPGTYSGAGNQEIDFKGKSLRLVSEAGPLQTLIDAGQKRIALLKNGEGPDTLIKGFTFFNAYKKESGDWARATLFEMVNSSPTIQDCIFRDNRAEGTYHSGTSGATLLGSWGGRAKLINCLIYNNTVKSGDNASSSDLIHGGFELVENCTIANNKIDAMMTNWWYFIRKSDLRVFALDSTTAVRNSIVWNNAISTIGPRNEISPATQPPSNPALSYSIFQGSLTGTGVINQDPKFRNASAADYALASGSPATNTGDPASALDPNGTRADMGYRSPSRLPLVFTRPNSFLIQCFQAGSTTEIDNLKITDLDTGNVVYENGFAQASDATRGLRLFHWPQGGSEHANYFLNNSTKTRVENGKLILETTGFNQNGAGGYDSHSEAEFTGVLPPNFHLEFDARRLQWAGHFHFYLFREDPTDAEGVYLAGGAFSQNRTSRLPRDKVYFSASGNWFHELGVVADMGGSVEEWIQKFPAPAGSLENTHKLGVSLQDNVLKFYLNGQEIRSTTVEGWSLKRRGDSAYVIVPGPTWEEAEANARKLGGQLLTINNSEENQWIFSNYQITQQNTYLAGFSDRDQEGVWKWSSGENATYTNWYPGEPTGPDDYLVLGRYGSGGRWNDATIEATRGIAEIKLPAQSFAITPEITTTPTASPILFGQTLSNSTLAGGVASVNGTIIAGSFAFENAEQQPPLGNSTHSVAFIPSDSGNFTTIITNVTVQVLDPNGDEDGDGLSNSEETRIGTNLYEKDSDGDGLSDGWERGVGRYEIIRGGWTFATAETDANTRFKLIDSLESVFGHLATITSAEEADRVVQIIESQAHDDVVIDMLLGAHDSEVEGEWRWITGEKWNFTNWYPGEPNNIVRDGHLDGEDYLSYVIRWDHKWVDTPYGSEWSGGYKPTAYLLEFGYPTDPLVADTDGDGFNDKLETTAGTDPNDPNAFPSVELDANLVEITPNGPVALGYPDFPEITVSIPEFLIGADELTFSQWDQVRALALARLGWTLASGTVGSGFEGVSPQHPVTNVTFVDVAVWCNAASLLAGLDPSYFVLDEQQKQVLLSPETASLVAGSGIIWNSKANGYRLPTGNEWEVAARGGLVGQAYPWGNTSANNKNSNWVYGYGNPESTTPVGTYPRNGFGLSDMAGNANEMTWDDAVAPSADVPSVITNTAVVRGGAWNWGYQPKVTFGTSLPIQWDARHEYGFRLTRNSESKDTSSFPPPSAWILRWTNPDSNAVWYPSWQLAIRSGKFLAGGVYSDDGIDWNTFTLPTDIRYWLNNGGIADSVFLLNGAGNDLWTSPNGVNWTKRANAGGYDDLTGIESGNGTIIVNRYWSAGSLLVSKNSGESWTYIDTGSFNYAPGTDGRHYERTVFGNNKFLFPLFDSVRTSADGLTWQTSTVSNRPSSFRMTSVGSFDPKTQRFIGVQQTGSNATAKTITTAISSDGETWTFREASIPTSNTADFGGASIGQGYLVVGGGTPPEMWLSADEGQSWSRINGPWEADGTTGVSFAASESRIVAATPLEIYSAEWGQGSMDNTPPVITLNGNNPDEVFKGASYTDPGAVVTDNVDAPQTISGTGTVNTSVLGEYTITYQASDAAGNIAEPVTRTVKVILDPSGDEDRDGLSNAEELAIGTNPFEKDTDGDGVTDYREQKDGTNPNDSTSFDQLSKGLVAYYPFDGNANDESGNGRHCHAIASDLSPNRDANPNTAFQFNGSSSRVSPQEIQMFPYKTFAISFWAKPEATHEIDPQSTSGVSGAWGQRYALFPPNGDYWTEPLHTRSAAGVGISLGTNGVSIYEHHGYYLPAVAVYQADLSNWCMVTVVYDNGQPYLFVNGNLVKTGINSGKNTFIGIQTSDAFGGGAYGSYQGAMDDIRIYDRALSAAEVSQLYNEESQNPNMVLVQGGTLPQGSELAGQVVGDFQIGKYEVTWSEWSEVREWAVENGYDLANIGQGSGENHPAQNMNWYAALKWCNARSEMEGLTPVYWSGNSTYRTGESVPWVNPSANGYRLPTEAEWEWAARGGISSQGYIYSGGNDLNAVGWYWGNSAGALVDQSSGRGTWPVGLKQPNELGLHDMSGNVWEWCFGSTRFRGGGWSDSNEDYYTVRRRNWGWPGSRIDSLGFRLARNAVPAVDTVAPIITLIGDNPANVVKGMSFTDPGAVVSDNVDLSRTVQGNGTVDTSTLGNYTITYDGQDAAGNAALPVIRTVRVILDPEADEDGDGLTNGWESGVGRYQIVQGSFTWQQAKLDAESRGGYLATITSEEEYHLLRSMFSDFADGRLLPWLGGSDLETPGRWAWITGEKWNYSRWTPGQPDGDPYNPNAQHYLWSGWRSPQLWDNHWNAGEGPNGYLLEFGYPTDPNNADTDGDGFNDKEETDAGTDPNNPESFPSAGDPPGGKPSGLLFTDVTSFATTLPEHSLHGVLDYDNDGQDDLLVSTGGVTRLWRFQGPLEFEDRTAEAGLEGAVPALLADFNNDGLTDILEVSADRSSAAVYLNNGASAFVKTSLPAVVAGDLKNYRDIQTADIDGDGDLDILYAVNPAFGGGAVAALLNTTGRAAGAPVSFGSKTYLVRTSWNYAKFDATDANGDGKTDLVILQTNGNWPNDTHPNHSASLYLNTGGSAADYMNAEGSRTLAGFTEKENCGITSGNEMSRFTSWDLDNDGDLDLINGSSDWPWVSRPHIYINDGTGQYTQQDSPVFQSTNYYHHGIHLFDADLDNDMDAVWTSLHNFANIYPRMWENQGAAVFSDATTTWGVTASIPGSGNLGSAGYVADLDGDGDQDLVVLGWNGWGSEKYYRVYRNDADIRGRNWLKIELLGEVSPAQGRGARVEVTTGNKTLTQYVGNDIGGVATTTLHFGLGSAAKADLVRVYWPSGAVSELTDVAHRQRLQIIESAAIDDVVPPQITLNPAPTHNARISESPVNFAGSVSDNRGVQSFEYRVNGGSWMPVPEANLSESFEWTLETALGMGANLFEFRATDSFGNESAVVSRTLFHTPDSDRDGVLDYREIADGTDPQDTSSFNPLSRGLIAFYPMDGNSHDKSGYGNDAANNGAVVSTDRFGRNGWAYAFDGVSAHLEAPDQSYLRTLPVTLSCWFRDQGPFSGEVGLLSKYQAAYWNGYQMMINSDGSLWPWYVLNRGNDVIGNYDINGDNNPAFKSGNVKDGTWRQAVFTVDETGGDLYIDGIKVASKAWRGIPQAITSTLPLIIGKYPGSAVGHLQGQMDDVRIYNRALTESEVASLFQSESLDPSFVHVEGGVLPQSSQLAGAPVADFEIGRFEVTWEEWQTVRDWAVNNGYSDLAGIGGGGASDHPVRDVNWYDAIKWSNAKSEMRGLVPVYTVNGTVYRIGDFGKLGSSVITQNSSANGYRLPTEAEWEWAARGGVHSRGYTYSGSNDLGAVAWYYQDPDFGPKAVGKKAPNELGIHDMSGNVWEWCWDSVDTLRRLRGGWWAGDLETCSLSASLGASDPDYRSEPWQRLGFRLARGLITDTSAPVIAWDEQSVDGLIVEDPSFVYGGTVSEENGLPVLEFRSAGSSAWTQIELGGSASPFAWSLPLTLPLGSSTFEFRARDAMGNQSPVATRTITYQPLPEYSVTVTATPGGSVSPGTSGISYRQGTQLQLGATPNEGYRFVRWAGDVSEANSVLSISVTSNLTLRAVFTKSEPPDASPEQSFTGGSSLGVGGSGAAVAGATDTAASPDGGFVSVGDFSGSFAFAGSTLVSEGSRDGFLVRHSPYGTPEWAVSFGAPGSQVKPARIDIAPDGTIYVGGTFTGTVDFGTGSMVSNGGADLFVASFDINGAIRWVATGGGSANESLGALIVGPQGDVFVTGAMPDNGGSFGDLQIAAGSGSANYEAVLARLGANGSWQWVNLTGGAGSDSGTALANGPQGALWWGGTYLGSMEIGGTQLVSEGGKDIFVALVNAETGEVSNAMSHGGRGADQLNSLLADGDGGFYAAGSQAAGLSLGDFELADSGSTDGFVARYQPPVGWTWAQSLGGDEEDMAVSLASDDEGRIYAAGYFKSSSLQAGQHSATNSFGITADGFLARFDGSGEVKWIRGFGGENNEYTRGLTHSTLGGLHVVGYTESGFTVGEYEIPAPDGFSDAFFVRLNGASSQAPRSISVTASAGGKVEVSPDAPVLPIGTPVVLEAIEEEGFAFEGWSGDAEGQTNPLSIILDRNLSIHATFVDAAPPVIRIDTPTSENPPSRKKTDFAGQITDNTEVAEAVWFLNGEEQGALPLDGEGNFLVPDVELLRGENHFAIEATDTRGNSAIAEVLLDWNAVRAFHTEETLKVNDGQKINVQLRLESPGDVGGFSVRFHFDSEVFTDPGFSFSGQAMQAGGSVTIGGNFVQVLYSGAGSTINSGTFLVGELNLRARSLPAGQTTDSIVNLEVIETSDGNGNQHADPTDGSSTVITVTARGKKADANGNGQIDTGDAAVIQTLINTPSKKRPWDAELNDLNGSGGIDSGDLTKILRIVAGLDQPPEDLPTPAAQPSFAPMAMATSATTSGSAGPNAYFLEEVAKVPLQIHVAGTLDDSTITAEAVLPPMGDTLYALQFMLQFPAQLLEIDRWEIGGATPTNSQPLVFSTGPGVLSYATFDSSPWAVDGGTVLRVVFKPKNISASVQRQLITLSGLKAFGEGGFELLATYQRPGQLTREPEAWILQAYGEQADPDADDDGDGLTNRQEYTAGTDPRSAASKLQLEDFAHDPVQNMQSLRWKAVRGVRYRVLASDDLKTWSPVGGTEVIGSDSDVEFEIKPDSKKAKSFFRIEAVR